MSKARPPYLYEIDLFELFETLWDGKGKIIKTIFVAVLFGIALYLILPNSHKVTSPIYKGKESTFYPYTALNELLKKNNFSFSIDKNKIFEMFVSEFNDYEEIIDVLSQNEHVKHLTEELDEIERRKILFELAKTFSLNPPYKNEQDWTLSFEWPNELEGLSLLNDALQQILINIQLTLIDNIEDLALAITLRNEFKIENLKVKLDLLKEIKITSDKGHLITLEEQSSIARDLKIESNRLVINNMSQASQDEKLSFNINSESIPHYLRGYKAIEKEISLMKNRSNEDSMLMTKEYIETLAEIKYVESDVSVIQLNDTSETLKNDNPINWVFFNLGLNETISNKKPVLYIVLSIILGGIIGAVYVLISDILRKRKKRR